MKPVLIIIFSFFALTTLAQQSITSATWTLTKIEDKKEKTSITLNHDHCVLSFEDSTYAGYGCNAFSGKYKISGNKIIFLGGMAITDKGCGQPDDYKAEDYILQNFIQLEFKQIAETLILNKGEDVIFTYTKQKPK